MASQTRMTDILKYAEENDYKELYALALWGFDWLRKEHYDNYGHGAEGIANVLKDHDVGVFYTGENIVIDSDDRLYVYAPIPIQKMINRIYKKLYYELQPDEREILAKLAAISLDKLVPILVSYYENGETEKLEKVLGRYSEILEETIKYYKQMPSGAKHAASIILDDVFNDIIDEYIDNMEAILKLDGYTTYAITEYTNLRYNKPKLAEEERLLASFLTNLELLIAAPVLADDRFYEKIRSSKTNPGALHQLAHMAAMLTVLAEEAAGLPKYEDILRELKDKYGIDEGNIIYEIIFEPWQLGGVLRELKDKYGIDENNVVYKVLKELGIGFFETEHRLRDEALVKPEDYEGSRMALINDGGKFKVYVKIGYTPGHYAVIDVKSGRDFDVVYRDYDRERVDALVSFLRRAGVQFRREGNTVEFEWKRPPEELGRLLAGLTSLGTVEPYDTLREAGSVNEFIRRRLGQI